MATLRINSLCWIIITVFYIFTKPTEAVTVDKFKTNSKENFEYDAIFSSNPRSIVNGRGWRFIYGGTSKEIPKIPKMLRSKIPTGLWNEGDDDNDLSNRIDDYGHMRFGKRGGDEQFDDYGHMRFGRNA